MMPASFSMLPTFSTYSIFQKVRLLYLLSCVMAGIYASVGYSSLPWPNIILDFLLGGGIGLAIGCTGIWIEKRLTSCPHSLLIGGSLGIMAGMAGTGLLILGAGFHFPEIPPLLAPWTMLLAWFTFPYFGLMVGLQVSHGFSPSLTTHASTDSSPLPSPNADPVQKLLDSSAIIDGRILPLCTTGFLEGPLIIPQGILHELQGLADSDQCHRRTKGKRGLEVLSQLQQVPLLTVEVIDDWQPAISMVDHQLIAIAKKRGAKIVTNDWNLAKIASVQGVLSLNVNELTYQLRPLVLPGETIRVFIHKEGQGNGQGIAHLDDGTMVVVDHGAALVGQAVEVIVSRFMQTNSGRMIFSSPCPAYASFDLKPIPS